MKKIFTTFLALSFISFSVFAQDLDNGLVAKYLFNGDANDASINEKHGTAIDVSLTTDRNGNSNSAYQFFSSTSSVVTPVQPGSITEFSTSFWIKTSVNPGADTNITIINNRGALYSNQFSLSFTIETGGKLFYFLNYDYVAVGHMSTVAINDNQWHLITGTFKHVSSSDPCVIDPWMCDPCMIDPMYCLGKKKGFYGDFITSSDLKLYIDGVLATTTTSEYGYENTNSPVNSPNAIEIGGNSIYLLLSNNKYLPFEGKLDDVFFYNRQITDTEVDELYHLDAVATQVGNRTNSSIEVFPNPAKEVLNIEGISSDVSVNIFDISGQLLLSQESVKNNKISLSDLSKGVYFIEIKSDNQAKYQKFIKE